MTKFKLSPETLRQIASDYKLEPKLLEEVVRIFGRFDQNNDGMITKGELSDAITLVRAGLNTFPTRDGELQALIEEIDQNYDGKIEFIEFCSVILPYIDIVFARPRFSLDSEEDSRTNGMHQKNNGRASSNRQPLIKQNSLASYNTRRVSRNVLFGFFGTQLFLFPFFGNFWVFYSV